MDDSEFWRDLAIQFQALDSVGALRANCRHRAGSDILGDWTLQGTRILQGQFEVLARRAAVGIVREGTSDLSVAWLEALRLDGDGFKLTGTEAGQNLEDGSGVAEYMVGAIVRVCEVSANFCRKQESRAVQAEHEERQRSERPAPQAAPVAPPAAKPETIGQQINRLREECRLTIDELAEQVNLDVRSVRRHLKNAPVPYDKNIWAYERVFSRLLNRQVVIRKMS